MKKSRLILILGESIISLFVGAVISALGAEGFSLPGWLISSLLIFISIFLLMAAIQWADDSRSLQLITLLAFAIRIIFAVALTLTLPVCGHENEQNQAGYLFYDAYERDTEAWHLAQSGEPIWSAFQNQYISDQYGGLLSIIAVVYRYLSPDVHRQMLLLILAAFAGSMGIPFLWKAMHIRWGKKAANWSAILLAFYPEAILLGSSHMREPYLIALICMAIGSVMNWQSSPKRSAILIAACLLGLLAFSWRVAIVITGILAIWYWLDIVIQKWGRTQRVLGWATITAGMILMVILSWAWFRETANYDAYLTERASGSVQVLVEMIGEKFKIPLVTIYGLTQPVLPAALVALSKPLASAVTIFRSVGWYLLAPILLYGWFSTLKIEDDREKRLLVWVAGISLVWVVASSMRAGGDMWDNPRYRTIFLPFFALIIGWVTHHYQKKRDPWLIRLYFIELLVVLIFLNWYSARYHDIGLHISFFNTLYLSGATTIIPLLLFWLYDRRSVKNHKQ